MKLAGSIEGICNGVHNRKTADRNLDFIKAIFLIRSIAFLICDTTLDFEDAKFMLVSRSAFINYLIIKANKAGAVFK